MNKTEHLGMERLTRNHCKTVGNKLLVFGKCCSFQNAVAPIVVIIKERVPYMFHMHPDLVGTSCFEPAFDQVYVSKAFDDFVVGYSRFAIVLFRENGKDLPVFRASPYVPGDGSLVFSQIAPYQG